MKPQKIKLGRHSYEVLPQPIGYLMNEVGSDLQAALESDADGLDGTRQVGQKGYELLKVFIPDLMPLYEFLGFASEEAMGNKQYDRELDNSPKPPQITQAVKEIKRANGGEVLDGLKAVLEQRVIQKATTLLISLASELMKESGGLTMDRVREAISTFQTSESSPTSPSTSGESDSMKSSEPSPTPPALASVD